ncbi:hypothetical protein PG996_006426 [Apiospora saccharicola]|uniref:Uncharacterized protein n=1 Tax=Apiospora saccharicola TaxID=335842 RepID=A0ABR1VPC0_9PEZI
MSSSSPSDQQPAVSKAAPPQDSGSEQAPLDQAKDKAAEVSGGGAHHHDSSSSEPTGPTLPLKSHFKGMPNQWEKNRKKDT